MKIIQEKKFWQYFRLDKDYTILSDFYYRNYQIFNRVTFLTLLFFCTAILGLYRNIFFAFPITMIIFIPTLYFMTKNLAKQLEAKRIYPREAREGDKVKISINITNKSFFSLHHFFITDIFHGSSNKIEKNYMSGAIGSNRLFVLTYERVCDAGMGKKDFGPLVLLISDHLGIFEFRILFELDDCIMVLPSIEQIPALPVEGTRSSLKPGHYDLPLKGRSITFHGVRDYTPGDPLSHIHWKLSVHRGQLVVKEFEKTVNAQITLLMNMSDKLHMGQGGESTWEYMRDIALSISDQQLENNNNIQIITNKRNIPFGEGKDFVQYLELLMPDLHPEHDKFSDFFVQRNLNRIPYASTIFYFTPILPDKSFTQNLMDLKGLTSTHCQIFVIAIDGLSYMASITTGEQKSFFQNLEKEKQQLLKQLSLDLRNHNIDLTVIPIVKDRQGYKESFKHE